jgi:hypothetical protein
MLPFCRWGLGPEKARGLLRAPDCKLRLTLEQEHSRKSGFPPQHPTAWAGSPYLVLSTTGAIHSCIQLGVAGGPHRAPERVADILQGGGIGRCLTPSPVLPTYQVLATVPSGPLGMPPWGRLMGFCSPLRSPLVVCVCFTSSPFPSSQVDLGLQAHTAESCLQLSTPLPAQAHTSGETPVGSRGVSVTCVAMTSHDFPQSVAFEGLAQSPTTGKGLAQSLDPGLGHPTPGLSCRSLYVLRRDVEAEPWPGRVSPGLVGEGCPPAHPRAHTYIHVIAENGIGPILEAALMVHIIEDAGWH